MAKRINKDINAGVNAITGFTLQRNIAVYLILENYEIKYKNANYFICLEHHDDCLICFLDKKNHIQTIDAYQSKKKSPTNWTLNKEFTEIVKKILCTGKELLNDASYPKSKDYSHSLFFVTNQTVNLKKAQDAVSIKEDNTRVNFKALPNSIKKHLQEHVTDKKLHSELENLNILWVDLSRTAIHQENQLIGQISRIFGENIESPKAALMLILELFKKIESTYNNNNVAALLDETKRVSSNDINNALDIITTQSRCYKYWREQKSSICRKLGIVVRDQSIFKFHFESSFDYFKSDTSSVHIAIKNFIIANIDNIEDAYDEVEMIDKLVKLYQKKITTKLEILQLKAIFFAAYFVVSEELYK